MRCEETGPLLSDYRERLLPDAQLEEIERHLWQCEQCRADLATLDALATQALAWPDLAPPEWHRTGFAIPRRASRQQWLPWLSFATSTACVVLLLAGVDIERDSGGFRMRLGAASHEQAAPADDALEQRLERFQQQQEQILKYQLMAWDVTRQEDGRKLVNAVLEYTRDQREQDMTQLAAFWQSVRDSDKAVQARAFNELLTSQQQSRRELRQLKASLQTTEDMEAP